VKTETVRVNFTIPKEIYYALKMVIPNRQRSKVITKLIKQEVQKRELLLSGVAKAVEKDKMLNEEMSDWGVTLNDGVKDLEWK